MYQSTAILPIEDKKTTDDTITISSKKRFLQSNDRRQQQQQQQLPEVSSKLDPSLLSRPNAPTAQFSMVFTYQRMILPLLAPPVLAFITPRVLSVVLSFFNLISNNCALGSFIASFLVWNYVYNQIQKYAPSDEKREAAFMKVRFRLEALVILLVSFVMRYAMMISRKGESYDNSTSGWESYVLKAEFLNIQFFSIRVTIGLLVLSGLIFLRFVGYFAIVQCTTWPLPVNPYQVILRNLPSLVRNLNDVFKPDQPRQQPGGKTISTNLSFPHNHHHQQQQKKFVNPKISQTISQWIIHTIFGFTFAYVILPEIMSKTLSQHQEDDFKHCQKHHYLEWLFLSSCAFTCTLSFLAIYNSPTSNINGVSSTIAKCNRSHYHELCFDKTTIPYVPLSSLWSIIYQEIIQQVQASGVLFYWIISPMISAVFINMSTKSSFITMLIKNECPGSRMSLVSTFIVTYVTTFVMCLYTMMIDICTRKFLTVRGLNIFRLVSQSNVIVDERRGKAAIDDADISNSNEIDMENLVVSIILAGFSSEVVDECTCPRIIEQNGELVRPIKKIRSSKANMSWVPSSTLILSNVDIEGEEVRRNKAMMNKVASSILTGVIGSFSALEEDLLKYMLLESLGGDDDKSHVATSMNASRDASTISTRHYKSLVRFLKRSDQPSGCLEIVSIIRALCAYSGGIGVALTQIALPTTKGFKELKPSGKLVPLSSSMSSVIEKETFSFQPCAVTSGTYAITAATRFILLNMKNDKARFNRISLLVPVVLQTSYTLRCGVLDYVHYLFDSTDPIQNPPIIGGGDSAVSIRGEDFTNFFTMKYPEMANLVTTCDECATQIMQMMNKIEGGNYELSDKVDDFVKEWLGSL